MRLVIVSALAAAIALVSLKSNANEIYISQSGGSLSLEIQQRSADNYVQLYSTGTNNTMVFRQGMHDDGTIDQDETGGHEQYWTIYGDGNTAYGYQTDTNRGGGGGGPHHMANIIEGDSNFVKHTQMGKEGHQGYIEITGDSNFVDLLQRGNGGKKWADVYLTGDDHVVNIDQRGNYGASAAVDLTNSGGAYNFTLTQNVSTSYDTYSVTGYCTNASGCTLNINNNN